MVEAARGEGRMGRAGLVSLSYARTMAKGSGTATPPWARTGPPPPGLYLRIVVVLGAGGWVLGAGCWRGSSARGKQAGVGGGNKAQRGRSSCRARKERWERRWGFSSWCWCAVLGGAALPVRVLCACGCLVLVAWCLLLVACCAKEPRAMAVAAGGRRQAAGEQAPALRILECGAERASLRVNRDASGRDDA